MLAVVALVEFATSLAAVVTALFLTLGNALFINVWLRSCDSKFSGTVLSVGTAGRRWLVNLNASFAASRSVIAFGWAVMAAGAKLFCVALVTLLFTAVNACVLFTASLIAVLAALLVTALFVGWHSGQALTSKFKRIVCGFTLGHCFWFS